jgi:hypothetical protein
VPSPAMAWANVSDRGGSEPGPTRTVPAATSTIHRPASSRIAPSTTTYRTPESFGSTPTYTR